MADIYLSPNTYFSRTISSARLHKLVTTENRDRALDMGGFDQFKDLFYSHEHKKKSFLTALYDHIHNNGGLGADELKDLSKVCQIIQSASFTELEDFFSGRDQSGRPLLHIALEQGQAKVITNYKIFLELLPTHQRNALLPTLLIAADQHGNPGLAVGLEHGNTNAIIAYKSLLELLPTEQRSMHLIRLLAAKKQNGDPGLALALINNKADTLLAYKWLLELLTPEQRINHLEQLLVAKDSYGVPGIVWALKGERADTFAVYKRMLDMITVKNDSGYLQNVLSVMNVVKYQSLFSALINGDAEKVAAHGCVFDIVPAQLRSQLLMGLLVAKDQDGTPGLTIALSNGYANAITAYKELLKKIPEAQRSPHLADLLAAKNQEGIPGLYMALQNGRAEAITAYKALLEMLPTGQRATHLLSLLSAKNKEGTPGLFMALQNGHAEAITAYKGLLELLPAGQRASHLHDLLAAKHKDGTPGLYMALQNGRAEAINAYKALLELLPAGQRAAHLPSLLAAKHKDGTPGLWMTLQNGHAQAITAYKGLLELLPASQRAAHLPGLLAAKRKNGTPGLYLALQNGHTQTITAYKALLELLSADQRTTHLPELLSVKRTSSCNYPNGLQYALRNSSIDVIEAYEGLLALIPRAARWNVYSAIYLSGILDVDAVFNHLDNRSHRSILTCIDNIDNRYATLKMGLMVKFAQILLAAPSSKQVTVSQAESIIAVWGNNPHYAGHPVIFDALKKVINPVITAANSGKLSASDTLLGILLNRVQEISRNEGGIWGNRKGTFMLENNGFFVQLMALCTNHSDGSVGRAAKLLYDQYLALPELAQHAKLLRKVFFCQGIRGTSDSVQEELVPLDDDKLVPLGDDDPAYLFVQTTFRNPYDGLIISKQQINDMLNKETLCNWSNVGFITPLRQPNGSTALGLATTGAFKASTVYPQFPLFRTSFLSQSQLGGLNNFLRLLNLQYTNNSAEPVLPSKNYAPLFATALTERTASTKLTGDTDQVTLGKIFERFLTAPERPIGSLVSLPILSAAHVEQILENYMPIDGLANSLHNARVLFCLAAVMAKLSSSSYFGTEDESPTALRVYAAGLLKKAYEVDPRLCSAEMYRVFLEKLLGLNGAFTCTAALYEHMIKHAQHQTDFKQILLRIKPIAWS